MDIQWNTLGCNLAPIGANIWRHLAPSGATWCQLAALGGSLNFFFFFLFLVKKKF